MSFSRHKLTRSENMERLTPAAQSPESLVYLHMSQRPFLIALGLAPGLRPISDYSRDGAHFIFRLIRMRPAWRLELRRQQRPVMILPIAPPVRSGAAS